VAFSSQADNLVAGDDANFEYDVFVRDTMTSTTTRVSVRRTGQKGNANSFHPAMSGDGRYVAFVSFANNLVPGDSGTYWDVFVHDRTTGATRRTSTRADGVEGAGNTQDFIIDISNDGQFVAFASTATDLVDGVQDADGVYDPFVTWWRGVSATPYNDLMENGGFDSGDLSFWLTFATPDASYLQGGVVNNVFEYYRVPPPPGTSNQAVVFQQTTAQVLAGAPLRASFSLGNTSSVRKRISVLIHDENFSDLFVCTFWLPPNTALQSYQMRTHTTKLWAGATISFYAATAGSNGGAYQLDGVSLEIAPVESGARTDCVDPTVPAPPGGPDSGNLVTNGDFGTGMLPPWGVFGQIVYQIAGGVFEFYRPPGTPSGVVLQGTLQAMTANQIMTLRFALANSSGMRKRVTVLLHDGDFLDLSACTFWLAPGQDFDGYTMRTFATKAWTNATVSVYPATVGLDQWIRLDEVSLERTPDTAIVGTECVEPGGDPEPPPETLRGRVVRATGVIPARPSPAAAAASTRLTSAVRSAVSPEGARTGAAAQSASAGRMSSSADAAIAVAPAAVWELAGPLDLTTATRARLRLRSWVGRGCGPRRSHPGQPQRR
jgi:hypothetical protein